MANENGGKALLIYLGKWALGILAGLIVLVIGAVVVGGGTASISTYLDVREMKIEQTIMKGEVEDLAEDLEEIDAKLDAHLSVANNDGGG